MALSATSKLQLNSLLSLLTIKDRATADTLTNSAKGSLAPTARDAVLQLITVDGWGSADPKTAQIAAVATLLADIAAN